MLLILGLTTLLIQFTATKLSNDNHANGLSQYLSIRVHSFT
jgi:hypothetical protein